MIHLPIQSIYRHIHGELIPTDLSLSQVTQVTRLVKDDSAQGTGVFHGELESRVGFFLTGVVLNDATTESGTLIWIQMMTSKLTASHPTDGMNKVAVVQVFKPILIRIMGVGATVKAHCRRVLDPILVTSIL